MTARTIGVALIHHPVVDRSGDTVTTAITNLDVHDIARSSHTFGVGRFFVVHPVSAQRELVSRIVNHWVEGSGAKRIPDRKPAMECVRLVSTLDEAVLALGEGTEIWVTSASDGGRPCTSIAAARAALRDPGPPVLLCFGTGWGLANAVLERATTRLEPIRSPRADGYNHLSVRAAVAIILDRLLASG
ncbi:MAG TPA: RNA methyltransferase [Polyangiaceae bacterium]|nr:RNA methyltransferase [Polyangiaceae bacterium]